MTDTDRREPDGDVRAIRALIARQFASLCWTPEQPADWEGFAADFLPEARLFPAARPVKAQSVAAFVERMKRLAGTTLPNFDETMLGAEIHVFGNVAVALGVCELGENHEAPKRGVEALLLAKEEGTWRIAAQAWDMERPDVPIPDYLLKEA